MRRYKPVQQESVNGSSSYAPVPLPVQFPCAIYARQSTARQVVDNIESSAMQTDELMKKAMRMGWNEGSIILYIENQMRDGTIRSASGTLRIDQREGLTALMERVYSNQIKVIFVYSESRLFRDQTHIQTGTFIQACKEHDVRVITNTYTYDFIRRPYDEDQFWMQSKVAADFIKNHVKGLLHPARDRKSLRGLSVAGSVPVGFIVDLDKKSDTYRKYTPYEPHASVVRYIFKRYRELGGRLNELGRELARMPFVFPDFKDVPIPARFNAKKVKGGYSIGRTGLIRLLTNTAYLGYWTFKGECLSKNNHAAIVDESDFFYAFKRLSNTTPDGEDQIRVGKLPTRFNHKTTVPLDALLRDVMGTDSDAKVYVDTVHKSYRVADFSNSFHHRVYSFAVRDVDQAFTQRLIWRLKQEHKSGMNNEPDAMNARLQAVQSEKQQQSTSVESQLEQTNSRISLLRKRLELDADTETLNTWAKELKYLVNNTKPALESKIKAVEDSKKDAAEFSTLLERVKSDWNSLSFEEKRRFVNVITSRVVISEASTHLLKIEIYWSEPYNEVDTGYLWSARGGEEKWTSDEKAILADMYSTSDRADILQALPSRSWNMITSHSRKMRLHRDIHNLNTSPLHASLSVGDDKLLKSVGVFFSEDLLRGKCEWIAVSSKNDILP